MGHLKTLLQWVSTPTTGPSENKLTSCRDQQTDETQQPIDLSTVTVTDRRHALVGPAAALLIEAQHYGVTIHLRDGRLFIRGKPPPKTEHFLERLRSWRKEIAIAIDSLNRGWMIQRHPSDAAASPDHDAAPTSDQGPDGLSYPSE